MPLALAVGAVALPSEAFSRAAGPDETSGIPAEEEAPIALMVDAVSGQILFARDPHRRFVPASITKVMTAYVGCELLRDGRIKRDQRYTVSEEAYRNWSGQGTSLYLKSGESVTVDTLMRGIMSVSANDGAVVLAEGVAGSISGWTEMMNNHARMLGMANSHFATPNGWPDEGQTFTSAADLAILARAFLDRHPACYARYSGHRTFTYKGVTRRNHDPITGVVKGADGIKTGYTRQAGFGFLGSAERDGHRLVMLVAASDNSKVRASAARRFMEWGFAAFDRKILVPEGQTITEARVQGGADRSVPLVTKGALAALVPRDSVHTYSLVLHYNGPIKAPVMAEDKVGEFEVWIDGQASHRYPALAGRDVPVANIWQRLRNGLLSLFA